MTAPIDLATSLDDEHRGLLETFPHGLLDLSDIPATRSAFEAFVDAIPDPTPPADVTVSERWVPGHDGDPHVRTRLYCPNRRVSGGPAILWIHGGGMVLGSVDDGDDRCVDWAARHGCVVVSVDYRLAPEHPAPALVHDCFAALVWLVTAADELDIDPTRIAIGGVSAGGGLAAGTALFARDQGGPAPMAQLLVCPMLDHRDVTPSSHRIVDDRVWNRTANELAWAAYLGGGEPTPYASPSIAGDLSGLPPAYLNVGTFDLFVDEDVDYAMRLNAAGTPCELHVYPGAFHGSSSFGPHLPLSRRWVADEHAFLDRVLTR